MAFVRKFPRQVARTAAFGRRLEPICCVKLRQTLLVDVPSGTLVDFRGKKNGIYGC
jgi:hypothetical protein